MARESLIAVVGLTPQVLTETLYSLTQIERPPVALNKIEVITTRPGRELIEKALLRPKGGQFHTFCRDYSIPWKDRRRRLHHLCRARA